MATRRVLWKSHGQWVLWSIAGPEPFLPADSRHLRFAGRPSLYFEGLGGISRPFGNPCVNIFIDVDYTLLAANGSLRPHARELFMRLREAGHVTYVWSGVGIRRWDMKRHDLDHLVEDYFIKPLDRHHERLEGLGVPFTPDFVIDDYREVVDAFGGYHVSDNPGPDDDQLLDVLKAIEKHARLGEPTLGDSEEPLTVEEVEVEQDEG